MRISLRFFLPLFTVLLFLITALFLVVGSTYFFYLTAINQLVDDKAALLHLVQQSVYSPMSYYRTFSQYPSLRYAIFDETAKNPSIVFLRVVEPGSNKIIWSSVKEEKVGDTIASVPYFSAEVGSRDGQWQGQAVKEIFISGIASEGLWVGVGLGAIRMSAFNIALNQGLIVLFILLVIYSIFYFTLRKTILTPLGALFDAMSLVRQGNLDVKIETKTKTEIGDLSVTFNEMIKDLKKSHSALEEARNVLETKVAARTQELKRLTESLDEQVQEKTQELLERVAELEKFRKLTEGRELKMLELKEENESLKSELAQRQAGDGSANLKTD